MKKFLLSIVAALVMAIPVMGQQGGITLGNTVGEDAATYGKLTINGSLVVAALTAPTITEVTYTGTTGATTYTYKVCATVGTGSTAASGAHSITNGHATLTTAKYCTITWKPIAGATGYTVWRTAGGTTQGKIATLASPLYTSFKDTGVGGDSASAPTTNTTGYATIPISTISGLTASTMIYSNASKVITSTAAPTDGQLLIGDTGGVPLLGTLTGTSNQITVTNGAGSITLSAPQDLAAASSPSFTGLTLSGKTQNSVGYFGSGGVITGTAALTDGQLLIGDTGSNPLVANITGTSNQVTVTNGAGTITLSGPQDLAAASSPTFASVKIGTGGVIAGIFYYTGAVDFASTALGACSDANTVTVTGAEVGDFVLVAPPAGLEAGAQVTGTVTSSNTVTLRYCNNGGTNPLDPASATWFVTVFHIHST